MSSRYIIFNFHFDVIILGFISFFCIGSTNFVILAILTLVVKGSWHFRQVIIENANIPMVFPLSFKLIREKLVSCLIKIPFWICLSFIFLYALKIQANLWLLLYVSRFYFALFFNKVQFCLFILCVCVCVLIVIRLASAELS